MVPHIHLVGQTRCVSHSVLVRFVSDLSFSDSLNEIIRFNRIEVKCQRKRRNGSKPKLTMDISW